MRVETRQSFHFGVNFTFVPPAIIDGQHSRRFVEALAGSGLEFDQTNMQGGMFAAHREQRPLQIRVAQLAPPVGQLAVLAPVPGRALEEFIDEAEIVVAAFASTWGSSRQVVARDCTIRHLYAVEAQHAFQYLWVTRLGQPEEQMTAFGRPILGGGLRLVIPPSESNENQGQIEVKIESLLADSRKLFVEVQIMWPKASVPNAPMAPREMLEAVDGFANREVVAFITGGSTDG